MAKDTVIQSPSLAGNIDRLEALAVGAILTGIFVEYVSGGIDVATPVLLDAAQQIMISTENISTAQDLAYTYPVGETVFFIAPPRGARMNVKAEAATYSEGDLLELNALGTVQAATTGAVIGVVPTGQGKTVGAGESLLIQLV